MPRPTSSLVSLLSEHSSLLVLAGASNPLDTIAASLALVSYARAYGKQAFCFAPFEAPSQLSFLGFEPILSSTPRSAKGASVSITPLGEHIASLQYLRENDTVHLILNDEHGAIIPRSQLHIEDARPEADLIVAIGATDEEIHSFCSLYGVHAERVLALHHQAITWADAIVDANAGSCCEILTRELKRDAETGMNERVATSLLAGLIASTNNFQNEHTRPQTLFAAAYLIARGANKDTVIRNLYKIKPISFMNAWGALLASFSFDETTRVGTALLSAPHAKEGLRHATSLMNELARAASEARVLILGIEYPRGLLCVVHCPGNEELAGRLAEALGTTHTGSSFALPLRVRSGAAEEVRNLQRAITRLL